MFRDLFTFTVKINLFQRILNKAEYPKRMLHEIFFSSYLMFLCFLCSFVLKHISVGARGPYFNDCLKSLIKTGSVVFFKLLPCFSYFSLVVCKNSSFCFVIILKQCFSCSCKFMWHLSWSYCCISILLSFLRRTFQTEIYLNFFTLLVWSFICTQLTRLYNDHNPTSREVHAIFDIIRIHFE